MNCEWTKDNLIACIDRELDPSQELLLKEHLHDCSACRREYEKIQIAWKTLDCWKDLAPPEHIQKNILREIKGGRKAKWLYRMVPAAAVLLIIAGIGFFYNSTDTGSFRQFTVEKENTPVEAHTDISQENVDDIIVNLQLLREKDFYDSLDRLEKIDYLPLVEDRQEEDKKESNLLEMHAA
ncbi:MAG: zf-HC2 domain-containing protein [Nitrospirota bacterium]|nr:zf-HC2 domain-containing protein [Nitrospirota bacterium]